MCWCFGGARLSRHRVCRVGRRSQIRFGSSAVHSPSSRAVVARGKVNFLLWSPGQQPRAGRVFFFVFFVGALREHLFRGQILLRERP